MSFVPDEVLADPTLSPGTNGRAFTFYGSWNGVQNGNACVRPVSSKGSVDHSEAEAWLLGQKRDSSQPWDQVADKIIVVGHSYGGYRAVLFTDQLWNRLGIRSNALITVDGISWDTCIITSLFGKCDQQKHKPKLPDPLQADFKYSLFETVGLLAGFSLPDGVRQQVDLGHGEIDDDGLDQFTLTPREHSVHWNILYVLAEKVRQPAIRPTRIDVPVRAAGQISVVIKLSATGLTPSTLIGIEDATLGGKAALNLASLANLSDMPYGSTTDVTLLFPNNAVRPGDDAKLVVSGHANSGQSFRLSEDDTFVQ